MSEEPTIRQQITAVAEMQIALMLKLDDMSVEELRRIGDEIREEMLDLEAEIRLLNKAIRLQTAHEPAHDSAQRPS